ncbi:MAG: hypothetical protein ACR2J6_04250 [Thermoleophilaceae bacterium]
MRLATLALSAALGVAGVVCGHDGGDGRYATAVPGLVLPGVVVAAQRAGRYTVDLYLTASLVPLRPLGDRVREAVSERARSGGLEAALGPVSVRFLSVEERLDR